MAKKKLKSPDANLRILSIAYASGRIDRKTYTRLRTQQLGALEFNKPMPPLPDNLMEIVIPTVKVDASMVDVKHPRTKQYWLYVGVALLVLGIGLGALWNAKLIPGSQPAKPVQVRQLEPRDYAQRLLDTLDWNDRDINAFLRIWGTRTDAAKSAARNSRWYLSLENEIIKRINKSRLKLERDPDLQAEQRELARLNRFYGQLTSN